MEQELFFTGYCRVLDGSRTVELILEDRGLAEVDCCYGSCLYQGSCPIARSMDEAISGKERL